MIEIKNLKKAFQTSHGKLTIFEDFNLTVKDSTFLGIQGKSGIGKTTLLSIIAGLQNPDSGTITIDTTELTSLSEKELAAFRNRNIGYISQEQSLLENLTIFDNVRLPAYLSKTNNSSDEEIANHTNRLLADFGILHLAKQYPSDLSGGENHRVLIARALINNPQIILADEPTDSVDEERTDEIIKIFKNLATQGKTVILVSHDSQALRLCDEVIKIK